MFDWLTGIVEAGGYLGIAFLMLLENVFPPIPSEIIMPLGGYLSQTGELNPILTVIAGSIGTLAGTWLWYFAAQKLSRDRIYAFVEKHGWWLTLTTESLEKAEDKFKRHEDSAVFWGRMVPAIRTVISVPAGFANMPLMRFLVISLAGTAIWTSFLTGAGYILGTQYEKVSGWLNPVTNVILIAIVGLYVLRLIRGKGRR
ncbi:DedA family protein [Marivita sp. GX14005]|uniref:DedA family protein n=1 Tax=Marivita sp. GX14005 TaxID=2942276 RepID=UPI00201987B4|nr:DedA family protein [Marivita sp. GX14005]MCL3883282.1 DedA family protein [Marivita sp. GX14005]